MASQRASSRSAQSTDNSRVWSAKCNRKSPTSLTPLCCQCAGTPPPLHLVYALNVAVAPRTQLQTLYPPQDLAVLVAMAGPRRAAAVHSSPSRLPRPRSCDSLPTEMPQKAQRTRRAPVQISPTPQASRTGNFLETARIKIRARLPRTTCNRLAMEARTPPWHQVRGPFV